MLNILIVDDEKLVRWFLERALSRWGHNVVSASSAREAVEAIGREKFDLVLTDLRMPEENGLAVVDKVGEMAQQVRPKIVICSAYVTAEMAEDFKDKGLSVLRKPFRLEELESVLAGLA